MKILLTALILSASSLYGQHAREIVNRYLDTVSNGNIDNWNRIKSTYTESEAYYSQQDFDQKVNLLKSDKAHFHKSYRVPPDNHMIEIYEDSTFTKKLSTFYFLKDRTILLLANVPPTIKPNTRRNEYVSDHLPVQIWVQMQKSSSVELLGIRQFPVEGLQCYEIEITAKDRSRVLYINTDTYLLEYSNSGKDGFLTKYSDYKRIDGLLMPMSSYSMRNGVVYYWNSIRKLEINADINPELFEYNGK